MTVLNTGQTPLARWGNVSQMAEFRMPVLGRNVMTGETYITDSQGPWAWRLRCDCGYEWEINRGSFPGRRKLKSCGRPECPHGKQPKRAPREPKEPRGAAHSIYLSQSQEGWLREYGKRNGCGLSKAIADLVAKAMVEELVEAD